MELRYLIMERSRGKKKEGRKRVKEGHQDKTIIVFYYS